MIIYSIRKKGTQKNYIGQTIQDSSYYWSKRKSELNGNRHRNEHLQRAWNKYGEDNFEFIILAEAKTQEELDRLEWIYEKLFGYYNLKEGGNGGRHNLTTREKIRKSKLGKRRAPFSNSHKENMSKAQKGRWVGKKNPNAKVTPEQVKKIRSLYNEGWTREELSKRYNIGTTGIKKICLGYTWKHLL